MERLKRDIQSHIPSYCPEDISWYEIENFPGLVEEKLGKKVFDKVIQEALDTYKCVWIRNIGDTIYLDKPLVMKSGYKLKIDAEQRISNLPGAEHCLIRNENIEDGYAMVVPHNDPDVDIVVDGGIWDGSCPKQEGCRFGIGGNKNIPGAMAVMVFSNVEQLVVQDATFCNGGSNYAVQISNAGKFLVRGLHFVEYTRDGVHMNGPLSYGEIYHLTGRDMGDDMVALNAWDWENAAVTFGTIDHIYVHDNVSHNNEFRLLPGRKVYEKDFVDCDIHHCIIEGLSGIYTFKMYCQPNIRNAMEKEYHDVSGSVGRIYDVYFKDIDIDEKKNAGFADVPVKSIFEVCADCNNIYFEDIRVNFTYEDFKQAGMYMMNVGPLSAVWKNHSENPLDWGEVFDPDAVCCVSDVYFKNVVFKDKKADDINELVQEIHMIVNPLYPYSVPKGGNGYGIVKNIYIQ